MKLKPFFRAARKDAPYKEARDSAYRILRELELVRPDAYDQLPGRQIFLKSQDYEFLRNVMDQLGV
jgi:hypothetical protein